MATLATIVTACRMESTKVEFALHRLLFHHGRQDGAGMIRGLDEARRSLHAEQLRLRQVQRHLRRKLALAGKAVA